MRTLLILIILSAFTFSTASAVGDKCCDKHFFKIGEDGFLEDVDIDFDDGSIIFTHKGRDRDRVEITDEYELYINDKLIVTNAEQKKLLREYHEITIEIIEYAKKIGIEGAKIGVQGAAIGLMAVGGVFKALMTSYEFEDLEDDLEDKADELEERAEELEDEAEELEDLADDLADVHSDLRRETPELRRLDWF